MSRRDNHFIRSPRAVQEATEPEAFVVYPALVEHLREMCPPLVLSEVDGTGGVDAAVQLAIQVERSKAEQALLAYLSSLVKNPDDPEEANA